MSVTSPSTAPLLSIDALTVHVPEKERIGGGLGDLTLVDDLCLSIRPGERVALVGESGSGKSITARAILRLDPHLRLGGSIEWEGRELIGAPRHVIRALRGAEISMIFQDPMTALNPVLTIGEQVAEPLLVRGVSKKDAYQRAAEMLDGLRVPKAAERLKAYPGQFSGGMRQRVVMAAALIAEPKLLIADEPTTALDVRVQEQVLDLLEEQSRELNLAVLFITHDLAIVAGLAQRVAVMFRGRVVEEQPVDDLFARPQHPYTRGLIGSVPRLDADPAVRLMTVADYLQEGSAA
ncbi:ABC transporter ATP-binding protein [Microbacterium rhizosphaerae]|uniref:ABC transporter ATP-binding protein n=1 Tax=Microbacterium rhizosphaerae TaxID=1678237 RepID=A0ABZ0SMX4_9MICO|nr:ABC transporter ATP-binding protein [Microbacterium rhizosphaerae]WPR90719.1 ABC transporter ATP-binding protein [Microbacterium rhizosphaerae]